MEELQTQLDALTNKIENLERILGVYNNGSFDEKIRNIITTDIDSTSARTVTITIPAGGGSANVAKTPDVYLRIYFRGKIYNIPAYNLV